MLALLAGSFTTNVAVAKPSEAPAAAIFGGHCYRYVTPGLAITWSSAYLAAPTVPSLDSACAGMPGYLAVITSAGENAFVRSLGAGDAWLGGHDQSTEGTWRWVSIPGTPTFCIDTGPTCPAQPGYYTNWAAGQPDDAGGVQDFLALLIAGTWDDTTNDGGLNVLAYVVEYDPAVAPTSTPSEVPEADTLLLMGGGLGGLATWARWQWSKRRARRSV